MGWDCCSWAITEFIQPDNSTMARVIEQQRLFAPIMYANWIALRPTGHPVVGYLPTLDLRKWRCGYAVPLRKDLVVGLFAAAVGHTMAWRNGAWAIGVPVRPMAAGVARDLNRHVACNSLNEVHSATRDAVEQARAGGAASVRVGPRPPRPVGHR